MLWPRPHTLARTGRMSQTSDERCLTYCSQSINGRVERRPPWCRTLCIRRVFAHEVRNVIGISRHRGALPDGTVKYPLPPEGQPRKAAGPSGDETTRSNPESSSLVEREVPPTQVQYWEEGWYLWCSRSPRTSVEHLRLMGLDLAAQMKLMEVKEARRKGRKDSTVGMESPAATSAAVPHSSYVFVIISSSDPSTFRRWLVALRQVSFEYPLQIRRCIKLSRVISHQPRESWNSFMPASGTVRRRNSRSAFGRPLGPRSRTDWLRLYALRCGTCGMPILQMRMINRVIDWDQLCMFIFILQDC